MSLIRRFSRRSSGRRSDSKKKEVEAIVPVPTALPTVRNPISALFETKNSTSEKNTGMDRVLYEVPQQKLTDAMTDLIKNHPNGDLFPYVGVVGSEGESPDARRSRLLASKPEYNKRDIPEIRVLGCPLISREGQFTMDSLMEFAQSNNTPIVATTGPVPSGVHSPNYKITKAFVHIRQVKVVFTPNVSSTSNYCNFWMNLMDSRLINPEAGGQTNVVVSNQEGILEMSCDYCIPARELSSFVLSYTLERDIVQPGFQWGTASFYFGLTESDLPYQSSKVDAMAVYRMPISTLMERKTNADKSDISFTPADILSMRRLYKQGDIVDVDEPQHARMKTSAYTKTSLRGAVKGEEIESGNREGWSQLKGARKGKVDAEVASVDPDDDSDVDVAPIDQDEVNRKRAEAIAKWEKQQEADRKQFEDIKDMRNGNGKQAIVEEDDDASFVDSVAGKGFGNLFDEPKKPKQKKQVRISASGV